MGEEGGRAGNDGSEAMGEAMEQWVVVTKATRGRAGAGNWSPDSGRLESHPHPPPPKFLEELQGVEFAARAAESSVCYLLYVKAELWSEIRNYGE